MSGTQGRGGLMNSVMDMFRSSPQTQNPQPPNLATAPNLQNQIPGQQPNLNTTVPGGATPGSNGEVPGIPPTSTGDQSPLAGFKDLWDIKPADLKSPAESPKFNFDPTKVGELAAKMDFTKGLDQALMQKALQGDAGAFQQILNSAGQSGFASSLQVSAKLVEEALAKQQATFINDIIPDIVRKATISNTIGEGTSSFYANPAAKPMVTFLENQMAMKYPQATPAQIAKQVETYFDDFAKMVVSSSGGTISAPQNLGNTQRGPFSRQNEETDWEKFLTS